MADIFDTHRALQWKLAGILERHVERIFKPGTKLTIIARTPGNNDAEVRAWLAQMDAAAMVPKKRTPGVGASSTDQPKGGA